MFGGHGMFFILERIWGWMWVWSRKGSLHSDSWMWDMVEYLNGINCLELPLLNLRLKIVLRNLSPAEGVCNGTRGIVMWMSNRVIEIELLMKGFRGKEVFIPRISLTPSETQVPFKLERRQFPVKLCFAITINKSQRQSVEYVGRLAVFTLSCTSLFC